MSTTLNWSAFKRQGDIVVAADVGNDHGVIVVVRVERDGFFVEELVDLSLASAPNPTPLTENKDE